MVAAVATRPIQISVKGLAKYMLAGPAAQRRVLRDYKYPDPEGAAQAKYYREARLGIIAYHQNGHDAPWLLRRADQLDTQAGHQSGRSAVRLRHNARGLRHYARAFADLEFDVRAELNLDLRHGPVRITVAPELHVAEDGEVRIIKLEFGANAPDARLIRIITQAMFEAAEQHGLDLPPASVLYIDVPRHRIHRGARMGARLARDIEAACQTIAAVWETL